MTRPSLADVVTTTRAARADGCTSYDLLLDELDGLDLDDVDRRIVAWLDRTLDYDGIAQVLRLVRLCREARP